MRWLQRAGLWVALALTGFSALALQVVWQRVISMHLGADAVATATVVAGFLAGLGIGSVIGGRVADGRGTRSALLLLGAAEAGVAVFAVFSVPLFHDVVGGFADDAGTVAVFGAYFVLLLVPTTLMGLSLPLAARVVTARAADAGGEVGRLYSVNTAGGAIGALVCGWHLVGSFGFTTTTRVCAAFGLFAAAVLGLLSVPGWTATPAPDRTPAQPDTPGAGAGPHVPAGPVVLDAAERGPVGRWYLLYAVSGGLALALQQTFFRIAGSIGRSNSYSFATVLATYLATFSIGAAVGSWAVRRGGDPRRRFLWLQCASGVAALSSMVLLIEVLPRVGLGATFDRWLNSDGFASGYDFDRLGDFVLFVVLLPLLVVGPSVFLAGASFPFVEQVVVDRRGSVGRRTGGLIAANTFGNVVGVVLAGFVLFDLLGTGGTYRLVALSMVGFGLAAAGMTEDARRKRLRTRAVLGCALVLMVAFPTNHRLWSFLSGDDGASVMVAEDAACASIVERQGEATFQLTINGTSQNGYPFDDFHVLIGLLPTLASDRPGHGASIGFGIGSTSYSMLADDRRERVTTLELCGGHYDLANRLADEGHAEFVELRDSPRHEAVTGDGRKFLLRSRDRFDAVVVDTLRVTSANSGQHFSREFYEMADRSMTDGGIFAQWVPTWRVQNSAGQVFPYLVTETVAEYGDSILMLASRSPIDLSPDVLLERFDRHAAEGFPPEQRERLRRFLEEWSPTCVTAGEVLDGVPDVEVNRDLMPRDEYHFNNGFAAGPTTAPACAGAPHGRAAGVDGG